MAAQRRKKPANLTQLSVSAEEEGSAPTAALAPQIHSPTHTQFETPPKPAAAPAGAAPDINSPTGAATRAYDFDEEQRGAGQGGSSSTSAGEGVTVSATPPPSHALASVVTQTGASGQQHIPHTPPTGKAAVAVDVPASATASPGASGGSGSRSGDSKGPRSGSSCLCCRSTSAEEPGDAPGSPPPSTPTRVQVAGATPPTPNARYPNSPTHHGMSKAHGKGDATPTPMKKGMPLSFPDGPLADHAPFALLPPAHGSDADKVCLVLDLDETLVHSSFEPVPNADYVIPVEIDTILYNVYVCKRPGCDEFLERMGRWFEVVVFTASLAKYANPLLDKLDPKGIIKHRLFREACVYHQGSYVKDMSIMGRDIRRIIIVDNSPASFMFQPESALGCSSFVDQMDDKELWAIGDFLERLKDAPDVRTELSAWVIP